MTDYRKQFSARLLISCDKNGITPRELARRIGMVDKTVYNYCYGTLPKVSTLFDIATALNVSVDYLLGRTDEMEVAHNDID